MKTKRRIYVVLRNVKKMNMKCIMNHLEKYFYPKNLIISPELEDGRMVIKIDNVDRMNFDVYRIIKSIPRVNLRKSTIFEKEILL